MPVKRYYRNKDTKQTSGAIYNIISDRVTLKPNLETTYWNNVSIFKEIEIVPIDEIFPFNELKNINSKSKIMKLSFFIKVIHKLLIDSLENKWNPSKVHLIFHSAGYDSRILSASIKELYLKNGKDWLGDILFICKSPEGEIFKKIMKYEGWQKSQYVILKDEPLEYDKEGFNYKVAWKHVNGISDAPVNFTYNMYDTIKKKGLAPQDDNKIQVWMNFFEKAFFGMNTFNDLKSIYEKSYYGTEGRYYGVFPCDVQDMYINSNLMKFIIETKIDTFPEPKIKLDEYGYEYYKSCKIRKLILGKELSKFKQCNWEDYDFIWTISNKLLQKAIDDYKNSWYYKNIDKEIINSAVNYYWERPYKNSHKWWNAWSMGSFTNYLIEKGIEIKL